MIKQLTLQGLRADLGQAKDMLVAAREANDVVAILQFGQRIEALESEIADLQGTDERVASVALFFGGRPVVGSRGVDATFASKAIDSFQRLVSRQFAQLEHGGLGNRGPVPTQDEARMIVTDVARGSVGFVLEESPEQGQMVETELRQALDQISHAISRLSADSDDWADALEALDERVVSEIKGFFEVLDEAGASVRIVEGDNDRELSREAIHRARSRVDLTRVTQEESPWTRGQIVGFTSKTFEFVTDTGEKLAGKIASAPARQIEEAGKNRVIQQLLFTPILAKFNVRTFSNGTWLRRYHTLIAIDDRS